MMNKQQDADDAHTQPSRPPLYETHGLRITFQLERYIPHAGYGCLINDLKEHSRSKIGCADDMSLARPYGPFALLRQLIIQHGNATEGTIHGAELIYVDSNLHTF